MPDMTDSPAASPDIDVLIADDQADVLDALRMLFHPEGISTHPASSPSDVIGALREREFDLLLMDLNYARDTTSGREGLDLLSQVRALDADLPIVVMTGWGTMEVAIEALRHGVRDFVQKPWNNDHVLTLVRTLAERRRAERRIATRNARELEEASRIQRGLFPRSIPTIPGWEIAATCKAAAAVGGDTYDIVQIDRTRVAVCLGDVAGRGIPAALLAANLQAAVRSAIREGRGPADLCSQVNRSLCATVPDDRFVTFFFCLVDTIDGSVRYCNAGHNPPLLLGADGRCTLLSGGGTVLGFDAGTRYEERGASLSPGSVLVLYTDGITEACNEGGEEFGEVRLGAQLAVDRQCGAAEICDRLLASLHAFSSERADDQTVVAVSRAQG